MKKLYRNPATGKFTFKPKSRAWETVVMVGVLCALGIGVCDFNLGEAMHINIAGCAP